MSKPLSVLIFRKRGRAARMAMLPMEACRRSGYEPKEATTMSETFGMDPARLAAATRRVRRVHRPRLADRIRWRRAVESSLAGPLCRFGLCCDVVRTHGLCRRHYDDGRKLLAVRMKR